MTGKCRVAHSSAFIATVVFPLALLTAQAEQRVTPPDLPSTESARASIDADPGVIEARRALEATGHGAAALRVGPHEWTTRITAQRRRYENLGSTSNEWTAALERTLRIGGKAALDAQLGDADILIGQAGVGEARHEVARALADLWIETLATRRLRELWTEQLGFAERSRLAVEKRRKAGDASLLDLHAASADLIEVQRQLNLATTAEAKAGGQLALRFPTLTHPPQPLSDPVPLDMSLPQWRDRILSESDPIKRAEGEVKKAQLTAARAQADRIPDPTVGVYTASEAFRNERIVGVSISIPLGGSYRSERMQQALREVDAASAKLNAQKRDEQGGVIDAFVEATGALARWRLTSDGLATTRDSARLTQRAYTLGEADLQTLLLARRQALDAAVAAEQARVDALRWRYRLLVDAHLIWGLEED